MKFLVTFLLTLSSFAYGASPCGLQGSVEERISDCNESAGVGNEFALVTRTKAGIEVYQGLRTGVIWSADLPGEKNYQSDRVSDICKRKHPEFGGLNLKWKLPPIHRYIQALKYGIQSSLPQMRGRTYWSSTSDDFYVTSRYIFEGSRRYRQDSDGLYTFRHLETDIGQAYVKCIVETI